MKHSIFQSYVKGIQKTFTFNEVTNLKDFWYFILINFCVQVLIMLIEIKLFNSETVSKVYQYATLLPTFSCGFRRLKDAGYNGFLFLLPIVNFILACLPTSKVNTPS